MASKAVGIIISVGVAVLIGVILVTIIAEQTNTKGQLYEQTYVLSLVKIGATNTNNYTYDYRIPYLSDAWRQDISECSLDTLGSVSNIIVYNSSGAEMMENGACSDETNEFYYVETEDTIKICDVADTNTSTYMTLKYQTCPVEYVSGWSQTVMNLVPGFFVLAILVGTAFVIFYVLRQEGINLE